jgi:LysM repeat protein
VLRTLCTTVSRLRELPNRFVAASFVPLLFALVQLIPDRLIPAYAGLASAALPRRQSAAGRFMRQMAVPLPEPSVPRPMAVPFESPEPSVASMVIAAAALAFAIAGLVRQETVLSFTHVALDGLRAQEVVAPLVDQADVPAMDPSLAWVMDPRPKLLTLSTSAPRPARPAVKPFEYEVRDGESLEDIARRFGTDVDALLWNNGLDAADQIEAGDRLMVLPVRGVLHLVKPGDTLNSIAERYGASPDDLAIANALDDPNTIVPDQVLVVAGGKVPLVQVAAAAQPADPAAEIAVMIGLAPAPEAIEPIVGPPVPNPDIDLPSPPNTNRWQREFILSIAPGARQSQRETGVPASVTLAQAILESDWGRSKLSAEANNLFGIKALREPGTAGIYNIRTWEVSGARTSW